MSDLYLTLRHRLDAVAEWVTIGADVWNDAQKRLGLSDERAARLVPVSGRTWIRWRQRGQVPIHSLERVAQILELEIERAQHERVVIEEDELRELRDELARRHDDVIDRLDRIEELARANAIASASLIEPR